MSSLALDTDLLDDASCEIPLSVDPSELTSVDCMFAAFDEFKNRKKLTASQKKIKNYVLAMKLLRTKFSLRYLNLNFAAHNQGRSYKCTISAFSSLLMVQSPPLPTPMIKDMYMHARAILSPKYGYTLAFLWRTFRWVIDSRLGLSLVCLSLEGVQAEKKARIIDGLMKQNIPFITNLRNHAQLVLEKNRNSEYLVLGSSGMEHGFAGYGILTNFKHSLEVLFVAPNKMLTAELDNCVVRFDSPAKQFAASWQACTRAQAAIERDLKSAEANELHLRNYSLLETIPCVHVNRGQHYKRVEVRGTFIIVKIAKGLKGFETFHFPEQFLQVGPPFHRVMHEFVRSAQFIEAYAEHPEFAVDLRDFDFTRVDGSDRSVVEAIRFVFSPFRSGLSLPSGKLLWWSAEKEYDNLCVKFAAHCPARQKQFKPRDLSTPCDPEYDGPDICATCRVKLPDLMQCHAICASGKRCTRGALESKTLCRQHLNLLMGPVGK